ncbi:major facilitator superfamily domain-containing protein 6-like [Erpetoichthys calabaricus]|uniref:Major facilitator superfamily domain containing 6-like n=1 Tax=Erpetoichthys calabaricus TaxID=27687 RepID=A0A8C4XGW6_ERPCA|nr:major facilitator superfamily domain-containing protein 6-like [Erpetoichthys calabaricus]
MKRTRQWDVHKATVLASLFYFVHSAAKACIFPFLTLYFRQLGLPAPHTGVIMGTKQVIYMVGAPLLSYLAGHYEKRRVLIICSLLCSIGSGLLLILVPPADREAWTKNCSSRLASPVQASASGVTQASLLSITSRPQAHEDNTFSADRQIQVTRPSDVITLTLVSHLLDDMATHHMATQKATILLEGNGNKALLKEELSSGNYEVKNSPGNDSDSQQNLQPVIYRPQRSLDSENHSKYAFTDFQSFFALDAQHQMFFLVLIVVVLWEVSTAPLEWTVDDSLYEYMDCVDAADRYNRRWMWGHVGAACSACGVGFLVSSLGCFLGGRMPRSAVHFYGYAGLMTIALLVGAFLPAYIKQQQQQSSKGLKALELISGDGRALLYASTAFLVGAAGANIENFLFWQMQDRGSSQSYMGMSVSIALASELFMSFFGDRVLRYFGQSSVVTLGLACMSIQCLYYSFLWSPWAVLPIQILSAFSSGTLWLALRKQCDSLATPGMERSIQRVFHLLSLGLGAAVGSFASGFIVSRFSLSILYRAVSVTLLLWTTIFASLQIWLPQKKKMNYSRLLAMDNSERSDSDTDQERDWLVKAMKDERGGIER